MKTNLDIHDGEEDSQSNSIRSPNDNSIDKIQKIMQMKGNNINLQRNESSDKK